MAASYLRKYGGTDWVRDSYDHFLFGNRLEFDADGDAVVTKGDLYKAIQDLPPLQCEQLSIRLGSVYLRRKKQPYLSETEAFNADETSARLQRMTYGVQVLVKLVVNGRMDRSKNDLCTLPLMVGSRLFGEQRRDGGYFVINGMEKVLINHELRAYETPLFKKIKNSYIVEVNSFNSPFQINLTKKRLRVNMMFVCKEEDFSFLMFVRALGCKLPESEMIPCTHADFGEYVAFDDDENVSQKECILKLGALFMSNNEGTDFARRKAEIDDVLENRLLPFLQPSEKVQYMLELAAKVVEMAIRDKMQDGPDQGFLSLQQESDPNSVENKYVETPGLFLKTNFAQALKTFWRNFDTDLKKHVQKPKKNSNVFTVFLNVDRSVTSSINTTMRDSEFVMQLPRRARWSESVSTICRVIANIEEKNADDRPRQTHSSYFGFYDFIESQEGSATGMSRDIALFCRVTTEGDLGAWKQAVLSNACRGSKKCYLNGSLVRPDASYTAVRDLKFTLDRFASVVLKDNCVFVNIRPGRLVRPVWVNGRVGDTWNDDFDQMVSERRVVFLDPAEVAVSMIAVSVKECQPFHEYVELHPLAFFGFSSARIPFANHNYAARNLFGSHVMHQSTGFPIYRTLLKPGVNFHSRFDSDQKHWMFYPQRALSSTHMADLLGDWHAPCGFNAKLMLLPTVNNEEDSVRMAKGFVERGGARLYSELSKFDIQSKDVRFGVPSEKIRTKSTKGWNFKKLDKDGIVEVGSLVSKNDVLVGKVRRIEHADGKFSYADNTTEIWNFKFEARVDSVCKTVTEQGETIVYIRFSWCRVPQSGDKLALRNGQKSIIAEIVPDHAMPFCWDGTRPDIVMNPFALFTRRTVGQLNESVTSKALAIHPPDGFLANGASNTEFDCTPFSTTFDFAQVQSVLKDAGFHPRGVERVFDANSGHMMQAKVFVGLVYSQRLIHFASEKSHARGVGAYNPQTMQPQQGRKIIDGGIKVSEVDGKVMCAHGAAFFQFDRFVKCSDGVKTWVCNDCQEVTNAIGCKCSMCGMSNIHEVMVPRVFLWFRNLLKAGNLGTDAYVDENSFLNGTYI